MTTALDPTFVKALKLLQSKSKDSTAQLRAMLDEAIAVRRGYGTPQSQSSRSPNGSKDTSRSVSRERPELERKEVEKRKDLDRLKADLNQLEPKRPRLNSPALSNSSHESPDSPAESEGSHGGDYGELQMNIELDCTCIICKSFNQESNNKLMECSSCQNLYHQECHEPPVSNSEASDPRLIWNCSRCTRKNPHSSSSSSRSTSVEKISSKSDSRPTEKSSKHSSSSSSSSSSHKSSKHHKPSPSKVSSKHKSSSSGSSLGSGSSGQASSVQMTEAQKRLKLMKKQAAAASLGKKKAK